MRYAEPSCSGKGRESLSPESFTEGAPRLCSRLMNSHDASKSAAMNSNVAASDCAGEKEIFADFAFPVEEAKPPETH